MLRVAEWVMQVSENVHARMYIYIYVSVCVCLFIVFFNCLFLFGQKDG